MLGRARGRGCEQSACKGRAKMAPCGRFWAAGIKDATQSPRLPDRMGAWRDARPARYPIAAVSWQGASRPGTPGPFRGRTRHGGAGHAPRREGPPLGAGATAPRRTRQTPAQKTKRAPRKIAAEMKDVSYQYSFMHLRCAHTFHNYSIPSVKSCRNAQGCTFVVKTETASRDLPMPLVNIRFRLKACQLRQAPPR